MTPFDAAIAEAENDCPLPADDEESIAALFDSGDPAPRDSQPRLVTATHTLAPILPEAPRFEAVDLTQTLPPIDYLVKELDLCAGAPAMLAGLGYAGKTVAAQQMAIDLVTDRPVWGRFAARLGARVLHVDTEQGLWVTVSRYQRLAAASGVDLRELASRLRVVVFPPFSFADPKAEAILCRELQGFDFAFFDSWRSTCAHLEENSSEARVPLDMTGRASGKTGAAVAWINHARKPQKDQAGGSKAAIRGSGAFFDACASVLCLSAEKGQPTFVEHQKARVSGKPAADFFLKIEDVGVNGDPLAGLRVTYQSLAEVKGRDPAAAHEQMMERIRGFLRANPGVPGKGAIVQRLGVNRTAAFAAFGELEARGEVFNEGTAKLPRLRLRPKAGR